MGHSVVTKRFNKKDLQNFIVLYIVVLHCVDTVCPGSTDPQEKIFNIFALERFTPFVNYYYSLG